MAKTTRLKMPVAQRAKQFAPFKAVTGLDEALEKVRRRMVQEEQHELSRDREEEINDVLGRVRPGCLVRIEYFRDGGYETLIDEVTGFDPAGGTITAGETKIPLSGIRGAEILEEMD